MGHVWRGIWKFGASFLVIWGACNTHGGVIQLDSFLGATVQETRYSETRKRVLQDNSRDPDSKAIAGLNFLTNNQVR